MPISNSERKAAEIVQNFLEKDLGEEEGKKFVKDNRDVLFSEMASQVFTSFVKASDDDPDLVQILLERRDFLTRCREEGIDEAFAETKTDTPKEIKLAIYNLIDAPNSEAMKQIVVDNRGLLLNKAAIQFIMIEIPRTSDEYYRNRLSFLFNLLRRCRRVGIEATFDELSHKNQPG